MSQYGILSIDIKLSKELTGMKKTAFITAAVMTASMIFTSAAVQADDISIVVNGEKIETETPAVIVEERTLVPLRAISEALGCDVSWDGDTKGITLTDGDSLYFTWIGRDHVFKTSAVELQATSVMDVPPVIMNDYTMVPLRAIGEIFGASVGWDGATSTVTVDYAKKNVEKGLAEKFRTYEKTMNKKYDDYKGYADGTGNVVNAEIQLENGGVIELELYPDIAPETVSNFVKLANEKFYDGLIFHRVISGFMIQGGGFDADFDQKQADNITGEFIANGYFNLIPHDRGVISMARAQDVNSASSQFFIMHDNSSYLNGQYAAFGKVTSGMEFVDAVAECETKSVPEKGMDDVPVENQVIKTVVIK